MADTYGFLRFQFPGTIYAIYLALLLIPFLSDAAIDALAGSPPAVLGVVGALILLGISVGYVIHQFSVQRLRKPKVLRPGQLALKQFLETKVPAAFQGWTHENQLVALDGLMSGLVLTNKTSQVDLVAVRNKLDARWSHLYARQALAKYSFRAALATAVVALLLASIPEDASVPAFIAFAVLFELTPMGAVYSAGTILIGVMLDFWIRRYSLKLHGEICAIELLFVYGLMGVWDSIEQELGPTEDLVSNMNNYDTSSGAL